MEETKKRGSKKKAPRKRTAKKKSLTPALNTAPYPTEYRQRVVSLILGLPFERAKESIAQRKLTVIPTTAWDWKRTYEKSGPEALVPKRTHVRDVADEMKRLGDVDTSNLRPIRAQAVVAKKNGGVLLNSSGSVESIRKLLELHGEHPDVFDDAAVLALISRIVDV